MRFVSFKYNKGEQVGILIDDKVVPLNIDIKIESMIDLIEKFNEDILNKINRLINSERSNYIHLNEVKLLAPIPFPRRNVFCLGKNYEEHAREIKITKISDTGIPEQPIYFTKIAAPAIAHGDQIRFSYQATKQVDYEVELAVVIGKEGANIKPEMAEDYIFGYTIINDLSARDLQANHKQWFKGKSLDTFCPMGPSIVYKNDIPFPVELEIGCSINGELRQKSNTKNMIFNIPYIIGDLSKGLTLKPGDIICTGTPSGVGMGFNPPKFLNDGDIIECYIEKIGKLVNRISVY